MVGGGDAAVGGSGVGVALAVGARSAGAAGCEVDRCGVGDPVNEREHPGARWLGTTASVARGKLSTSAKLTMARMDIDSAVRTLEQHGDAMRAAEGER